MAWQSKFIQDTDIDGLGTTTAIYSTSGVSPIMYTRRVDTNDDQDIIKFCHEAESILDKYIETDNKLTIIFNKIMNNLSKEIENGEVKDK